MCVRLSNRYETTKASIAGSPPWFSRRSKMSASTLARTLMAAVAVGVDVFFGQLDGDAVENARARGGVDLDVHVGGLHSGRNDAHREIGDRGRFARFEVELAVGLPRVRLLLHAELDVARLALFDG